MIPEPTLTLTADMRVMISAELDRRVKRGERIAIVRSVPRTIFVSAHERQSDRNHGQTLEDIRKRGGFSATEMIAVLSCLDWEAVGCLKEEAAHRILYSMIATHNRGMRVAEQREREAA